MNGTQTRRQATALGKAAKQAVIENDYLALTEIIGQLHSLQDYANEKENYFKYEVDEDEDVDSAGIAESWRFEKASDALKQHIAGVEKKLDEMETRFQRRLAA